MGGPVNDGVRAACMLSGGGLSGGKPWPPGGGETFGSVDSRGRTCGIVGVGIFPNRRPCDGGGRLTLTTCDPSMTARGSDADGGSSSTPASVSADGFHGGWLFWLTDTARYGRLLNTTISRSGPRSRATANEPAVEVITRSPPATGKT